MYKHLILSREERKRGEIRGGAQIHPLEGKMLEIHRDAGMLTASELWIQENSAHSTKKSEIHQTAALRILREMNESGINVAYINKVL